MKKDSYKGIKINRHITVGGIMTALALLTALVALFWTPYDR